MLSLRLVLLTPLTIFAPDQLIVKQAYSPKLNHTAARFIRGLSALRTLQYLPPASRCTFTGVDYLDVCEPTEPSTSTAIHWTTMPQACNEPKLFLDQVCFLQAGARALVLTIGLRITNISQWTCIRQTRSRSRERATTSRVY